MSTISDLKNILKEYGLSTTGTKAVLQRRIDDYNTFGWKKHETIYYRKAYGRDPFGNPKSDHSRENDPKHIASFDLDHTLVEPTNGEMFSSAVDDWQFLPNVKESLKKYRDDGYNIAIFTNQKKKAGRDITLSRIANIITTLDIPIDVFVSTSEDDYRKPNTGMWKFAQYEITEQSFYVGDAGGRENDFSDSDFLFAKNIGINFIFPETFFQRDPKKKVAHEKYNFTPSKEQEMIIAVGYPASGKTTTYHDSIEQHGYIHISKDLHKKKTYEMTEYHLSHYDSIYIDNTNPSKTERKLYIDIAKKYNVKIRVIWFIVDMKTCKSRNEGRKNKVSTIVFNIYKGKFEEPTLDEGINEIIQL